MLSYLNLASGIIVLVGIFIFIFFIYRSRKLKKIGAPEKPEAIEHYEKIRDKLTVREKEPEEQSESLINGPGIIGSIIGGFIVIFVGYTLLPEITKQVEIAATINNVTSSTSAVMSSVANIIPVFFALGLGVVVFVFVANSFAKNGRGL